MNNSPDNKGFALLMAVIISGVVLSIGLGILMTTVKQVNIGTGTVESERAFQVAAAAMDCVRYLRNEQSNNFIYDDQTVDITCFGVGGETMDDSLTSSFGNRKQRQSFAASFDVNTGVRNLCMEIEVRVLNTNIDTTWSIYNIGALASYYALFPWLVPPTYTPDDESWTVDGETISCDAYDICTRAVTRGYNYECADIATEDGVIVRELTAEF